MKEWRINRDTDILLTDVARCFIEAAQASQRDKGFFAAALGGGRTPVRLNGKIVELAKEYDLNWTRVYLFFSDERCVPENNDFSNYKMIYETLGRPLDIPLQNIFRIRGELGAEEASALYEKIIMCFFDEYRINGFDLTLLGVGEDCHTASLFPGAAAIKEECRLVVPGGKGKEGLERVTMSFNLINGSGNIWFLICGEEKREALNHILTGECDPCLYPAQGVYCKNGNIIYFTDNEINCF